MTNAIFSVLVSGLMMGVGANAFAEEPAGEVSPAADAATNKAKLPGVPANREDIDQEITNARLRASTGAKSLLSLQSSLNYNGGSVNTPLSSERPRLATGSVVETKSALQGQISAKYRATDHDNLNVGVGLDWVTPSYAGERGQIDNPYVGYTRLFKAGELQNVFNVQLTKYTSDELNKQGYDWNTDVNHTILYNFGGSRWQLGLVGEWSREYYSKDPGSSADATLDTLAAFPFAEYEINSTFSFRTVYRGFSYSNSYANTSTFQHQESTHSAGVGISVTRDVYLYPNVQWVWGDVSAEKTNVALAAYINL